MRAHRQGVPLWPLLVALIMCLPLSACGLFLQRSSPQSVAERAPVTRAHQFPAFHGATTAKPVRINATLSPDPNQLWSPIAIQFVTPQRGFVVQPESAPDAGGAPVSGILWTTTDGGRMWSPRSLPRLTVTGMHFTGPSSGFVWGTTPACGAGTAGCAAQIFTTSTGGLQWTRVLTVPGMAWTAAQSYAGGFWVEAVSTNCFGSCTPTQRLYGSTNGGTGWTMLAGGPSLPAFSMLWSANGLAGYAVSDQTVYVTHDAGHTWTPLGTLFPTHNPGFQGGAGHIVVPAPGVIYVSVCNTVDVGNGGCQNSLFASTNGGHTFTQRWTQYCTQTTWAHMTRPSTGVLVLMGWTACQNSGPLTNAVLPIAGGRVHTTGAMALPVNVTALSFLNAEDGWVAGEPEGCGVPGQENASCTVEVLATTDGGRSWSPVTRTLPPLLATRAPYGTWFGVGTPTVPDAWFRSPNGVSWTASGTLPVNRPALCGGVTAVQASSRRVAYVTLQGTTLDRLTATGGATPLPLPGHGLIIVSMSFPTPQVGYVVAATNRCQTSPPQWLYVTRDGGRDWIRLRTGGLKPDQVAFLTAEDGYLWSATGFYRTDDGGRHWTRAPRILRSLRGPGLESEAPGLVQIISGTAVYLIRPGQPLLDVHLALVSTLYESAPFVLPEGRTLTVFDPGAGVWTGPLTPTTTLRHQGRSIP
jgi:photosystem II stability/assembly factor-like uncharacterized protein